MIKEITEKFGNFNVDSLKERFKDDPGGLMDFKFDIEEYWEEIRSKYRVMKLSVETTTHTSVHYYYIPEFSVRSWFEPKECSIFEYGLMILDDGEDLCDKHENYVIVEIDVDDRPDDNITVEWLSVEEFIEKWNKTKWHNNPYKDEPDRVRTPIEDIHSGLLPEELCMFLWDLVPEPTDPLFVEIRKELEKEFKK